jgi:hypothetical protein
MAKPSLSDIPGQEKRLERAKDTITEYYVAEKVYNVAQLKSELEQLEYSIPEPSNEELIEVGKQTHPFYMQNDNSTRIAEIKSILGIK